MIRLFETLRAVFYTPFYLALELNAYADQGLDVQLGRPSSPQGAAESLFDGRADVMWGGPMRMLEYIDSHKPGALVGFAEVVTRDPFYLVGSSPNPSFRPSDLCPLRLATVSEVPTPWLCLRDDLERAGVDTSTLRRTGNRSMGENADALHSGDIDVVQLFEPFVEALVHEGRGHIWYAAAARGPTTYTTLYTSRRYAEDHSDVLAKMTHAIHATQKWLHSHDAIAAADKVGRYFPDIHENRLAGAIARYVDNGVWGTNPRMPIEGFVRLKSALIASGLIRSDIPFESCIDNRYADQLLGTEPN